MSAKASTGCRSSTSGAQATHSKTQQNAGNQIKQRSKHINCLSGECAKRRVVLTLLTFGSSIRTFQVLRQCRDLQDD